MTRNVIPAHERKFLAELLAERDRLAANDRKPNLFERFSENDPYDQLGNREWHRRSTLDRVADALGSRDFFMVYIGIYIGCFLTVGCAFLWSVS